MLSSSLIKISQQERQSLCVTLAEEVQDQRSSEPGSASSCYVTMNPKISLSSDPGKTDISAQHVRTHEVTGAPGCPIGSLSKSIAE